MPDNHRSEASGSTSHALPHGSSVSENGNTSSSEPAESPPSASLHLLASSSKAVTPHAEHLRFGHIDYEEIERNADEEKRHYLIRRPRAHQWFFKGKLFRSPEGRSSGRIELFFDLIYVALIATIAEAAVEEPTGAGLVKCRTFCRFDPY